MYARHALERHGEKIERIGGAQIRFGGERESGQIGERAQVVGTHAARLEALAVGGIIGVGMMQRGAQALELQRLELAAPHARAPAPR